MLTRPLVPLLRHEDPAGFEAKGWGSAANLGPVHGCYSLLMELHAAELTMASLPAHAPASNPYRFSG